MSQVRVFIAMSLDGYIAGPDDEIDWLEAGADAEDTFAPFMRSIGAMLMGRRTYDVVAGLGDEWPYGDTPVLVATHRELKASRPTVRAVQGSIAQMLDEARGTAASGDVYLDGGQLIRNALDAGLVDDMVVTVIPTVLGAGIPLFAGAQKRSRLELVSTRELGGNLVELRYRPVQA